jgi:hypothetical protein
VSLTDEGTLFAALTARAASALSALDATTPPRMPMDIPGVPAAGGGWGFGGGTPAAHGSAAVGLFRSGAAAAVAAAGAVDDTPQAPLEAVKPLQLIYPDPFDDRPASCKPKARASDARAAHTHAHARYERTAEALSRSPTRAPPMRAYPSLCGAPACVPHSRPWRSWVVRARCSGSRRQGQTAQTGPSTAPGTRRCATVRGARCMAEAPRRLCACLLACAPLHACVPHTHACAATAQCFVGWPSTGR